ncbi:histidine kinase [Flavobacterium sp. ENC]|uniref:sensor histidine kinase n=1 Tax=Flavobacterium sp. ENC TaxID=2897330 RepID=UPI001E56884A|nr:histidine kinase [Flavobacterium sp. ENC]MCD0468058.1 histidine kinase [Flavobacterium sp. ENC]
MKQVLVVLILLINYTVSAQYRNKFDVIDSRNGLTSDYVYCVKEGLHHNIWIATDNGLTRFNGTVFKNFSIENGLSSNNIFHIEIDSQNRVWACDYNYGLNYVKNSKVYYIKKAKKIPGLVFCFERKGTVYFTSVSNGKCYFLTPGNSFLSYNPKKSDTDSLHFDKTNKILTGYDRLFKNRFIIDNKKEFKLKPFYAVTGKEMSLSDFGLFSKSDKIAPNSKNGLKSSYYSKLDLLIDNLKEITPLYKAQDTLTNNTKGSIFTNIADLIEIKDGKFKFVFIDSNKNFWLIDEKNKLYYIKYSSLEIMNKLNISLFSSNDIFINKSCLAHDKLFFITNTNSFGCLDLETYEVKIIREFEEKLYNLFYFDDAVCIISKKGKYFYTDKKKDFHFTPILLLPNLKKTFLNNDSTLFAVDENTIKSEKGEKLTFDFTNVRFNHFDVKNDIAVFSNEEVIAAYNFKTKKTDKTFSIKQANFITTSREEIIVGTGARMVYFLDDKLKIKQKIRLKDNCYFMKYYNDKIYLASYKDITIYEKKRGKWTFLNKINFEEGVLRGKISDFVFHKDKVIVLTDNGISVLKNSYLYKTPKAQIQIIDFIVKEKSILNVSDKTIDQGKYDNILIRTSLRTFDNKDCFEVFYRLIKNKNYNDASWKKLSNRNVFFDDLSHGDYLFEVCSRNLKNTNQKSFDKITFTITPYFWETRVFFTVVLVLYLLMILLFLRYFRRRINKRNKLKLELITLELKSLKNQMKPHFLFNALNNLQGLLFTKGVEEANLFLIKFSRLLRSTLEVTRDKSISLEEEIKYIKTYLEFEQIRSNNELFVTYKIQETLDLKRIEIPVMVVQTIIENAILHGLNPSRNKKELLIEICQLNNSLRIIIEDNGVGRSKSGSTISDHKSVASLIIDERFRILTKLRKRNHSLEIIDLEKDGLPCGTRVVITIPVYYLNTLSPE